jgi:YLATT-like protein
MEVSRLMPQVAFIALVIGVILAAGLLGGAVNYFMTKKDDPDGGYWKSATLGIAAALLVPLFLNMISSTLLDSIRNTTTGIVDLTKILVFTGFCLVAAISSTAFIKTLSDRILQEAREAKKVARQADKKASDAQADVQLIVEKETEAETSSGPNAPLSASTITVSENEAKLLRSLATGRWVLRTRTGLAKETGINKPEVDSMMDELRSRQLVGHKYIAGRAGEKKKRWYITNEGRQAIPSS